MEIILFILSVFSLTFLTTTVVKDRKDYFEWESGLPQRKENI